MKNEQLPEKSPSEIQTSHDGETAVIGRPNLNFYERPFHQAKYGTWVYDAKGNFCFEFSDNVPKHERNLIIFRLNALDKESEKIPEYQLDYFPQRTMITHQKDDFIEIRGWGNLTGVGAHNFDVDKAAEIQDNFAAWIIGRLS